MSSAASSANRRATARVICHCIELSVRPSSIGCCAGRLRLAEEANHRHAQFLRMVRAQYQRFDLDSHLLLCDGSFTGNLLGSTLLAGNRLLLGGRFDRNLLGSTAPGRCSATAPFNQRDSLPRW